MGNEAAEQRRQWDKAQDRIDPPPQPPLTSGDKAEPAHTEADPLPPITKE
jgi:hypothetical protein